MAVCPYVGPPGTCGPPVSPIMSAEWLSLSVLVVSTTCGGRPQAGSDGIVQLVWCQKRCYIDA